MAKKIQTTFHAKLDKNDVKGGGWLATVRLLQPDHEGQDAVVRSEINAFANAGAGKRWIKEKVAELTPRKSVKLTAGEKLDAKDKPVSFVGALTFKADA